MSTSHCCCKIPEEILGLLLNHFWALMAITVIAIQCISHNQQNNNLGCQTVSSVKKYWWVKLKTKQSLFVAEASIKKNPEWHFFCFYFRSVSPLPSLHLFCSCQTRPKGGVESTWARSSRLPPISRHLPACYQSTLYSHPAEKQLTLKETEGDLVWWSYGVCERG